MSDVLNRAATPADIAPAVDLYTETYTDLCSRLGLPLSPVNREDAERGYRHALRTGIIRVAERDGRLAAVCVAIVRERLWFLSGFWVRPDLQGRKIGGPLLREVRQAGADLGAETFSVWSTMDPAAVATYMGQGMMPGFQLMIFIGPPTVPPAPEGCVSEPLELAIAVAMDLRVRGAGREADHKYWLEMEGAEKNARQVRRDGKILGYYYCRGNTIGAAAWNDPENAADVLALAMRDVAPGNETVRMNIPGVNHAAIRFALGSGLRLVFTPHFLTSAPWGMLDRYLPSGPLLF